MNTSKESSGRSPDQGTRRALVFLPKEKQKTTSKMHGIPTAAERYYAQPRFGSTAGQRHQSRNPVKADPASSPIREEFGNGMDNEDEQEATPVRKKRKLGWIQSSPVRHSERLIPRNIEEMQNLIRKRLAVVVTKGEKIITFSEMQNRSLYNPDKPLLSDHPQDFHTTRDDCRLHLASTIEDRLSLRGAITPTIYNLKAQLPGWRGDFRWNPDSSYIEILEKCMLDFYDFALTKVPELDPMDLPDMIALLPWQGKISDFRSSPNWPSGW